MFVLGEVDQTSIDVTVTVTDPSGETLREVDARTGGIESFHFETGTSGTYEVTVAANDDGAGDYEFCVVRSEAIRHRPDRAARPADESLGRRRPPGCGRGRGGPVASGHTSAPTALRTCRTGFAGSAGRFPTSGRAPSSSRRWASWSSSARRSPVSFGGGVPPRRDRLPAHRERQRHRLHRVERTDPGGIVREDVSTTRSRWISFRNDAGNSSHASTSTRNGRSLSSNASRRSATCRCRRGPANATRSRSDDDLDIRFTRDPYAQTSVSGRQAWIRRTTVLR